LFWSQAKKFTEQSERGLYKAAFVGFRCHVQKVGRELMLQWPLLLTVAWHELVFPDWSQAKKFTKQSERGFYRAAFVGFRCHVQKVAREKMAVEKRFASLDTESCYY
jgi:hypothetical protein